MIIIKIALAFWTVQAIAVSIWAYIEMKKDEPFIADEEFEMDYAEFKAYCYKNKIVCGHNCNPTHESL